MFSFTANSIGGAVADALLGLAVAIGLAAVVAIIYCTFIVLGYGYYIFRAYIVKDRQKELGWKERLSWLFFVLVTIPFFFWPTVYLGTEAVSKIGKPELRDYLLAFLAILLLTVLLLLACDQVARRRWNWKQKRPTAAERIRSRY
jgi:hypothetical protein